MKTFLERITCTNEEKQAFNQERAILEATELICEIMDKRRVTRSELARRLGKTKGFVTQLLDGRANMTIRTLADIFTALDHTIHFRDSFEGDDEGYVYKVRLDGDWQHSLAWPDVARLDVCDDQSVSLAP
jgi:transcriptional regulator with XRE-family HTH domain